MPLRALNYQSPLETLKGQNTYTVPPKVFGCVCFVHIKDAGKLDPRALRCVFIGYSPTQKGYKCFHPPSRKYFVSMDVTFRETESYFSSTPSSLQGENNAQEEMIHSSVTLTDLTPREDGQKENIFQENIFQGEEIGRLNKPDLKERQSYNRRSHCATYSLLPRIILFWSSTF